MHTPVARADTRLPLLMNDRRPRLSALASNIRTAALMAIVLTSAMLLHGQVRPIRVPGESRLWHRYPIDGSQLHWSSSETVSKNISTFTFQTRQTLLKSVIKFI